MTIRRRIASLVISVLIALGSLTPAVLSTIQVNAADPGFVDVYENTPHYQDIFWMKSSGVSEGWLESNGTRTFRPMNTVVRQDMAAFLRREASLLGVESASSYQPSDADWRRFKDVNRDTPHAEDILWMAKEGITTGYPDGTYGGMIPVYRQDMAAFLHRLANLAGVQNAGTMSFTDVNASTPHAQDIYWLGGTGISTGYPDGTYQGMWPVYRQDMAAFLRRLRKVKDPSSDSSSDTDNPGFEAVMLDVGQGLSIFVKADGHTLLFDGGPRSHSSYVVAWLKQHGISSLDYMIASHYDEDHIAGLIGVLHTTQVNTLLCPDTTSDTNIYNSFVQASSGVNTVHPQAGDAYVLGNASFQVVGPIDMSLPSDNNKSIAIRISYGNFSMIITGDAEKEEEADMVNSGYTLKSDLYVAGHHGSSSSSSSKFVSAVSPSDVWISCGKDNSYGHPSKSALQVFKDHNEQIYRTDDQGEVSVYSNGSTHWFPCAPDTNWTPGDKEPEPTPVPTPAPTPVVTPAPSQPAQAPSTYYVLNISSKKFHLPTCPTIKRMSSKNKRESNQSRQELIDEGYIPCKVCNP